MESSYRTHIMRLFGIFILILVMGTSPLSAQNRQKADTKNYPVLTPSPTELKKTGMATVKGVIDALHLQLDDNRIIYLAGLDIPDFFQRDPGEFSLNAKNLIETLFLDKKVNIYQAPKQRDTKVNRMGHHIAHITLFDNDVWAQGALIAEGLARVRTDMDSRFLAEDMLSLEKIARENIPKETDGENPPPPYLWNNDLYKILNLEDVENAPEGFQIVEGKITKTAIKSNRIFLNFGRNWRNDFTVAIKPESRRLFSKDGGTPVEWQGKTIRVRGWLDEYNGPYIEVDHPERIEFIDDSVAKTDSMIQEFSVPPTDKEIIKNALPNIKEFTAGQ